MKIFLTFFSLIMGIFSFSFAQYDSSPYSDQSGSQNGNQQGQYNCSPQQGYPYSNQSRNQQRQYNCSPQQGCPYSGQQPADCSSLSQQEQQFARQLSPIHRTVFCREFSASQRIDAMTLASSQARRSRGAQGYQTVMTPDEAVEAIIKKSRGAMIQTYPNQQSPSNPYSNY